MLGYIAHSVGQGYLMFQWSGTYYKYTWGVLTNSSSSTHSSAHNPQMSKSINVYSTSEAQKALDELLPSVFARLGYREDHTALDIKLALGYTMAAIAVGSFLLDKKFEKKEIMHYQLILTVLYFALSLVYWVYQKTVNKNAIYHGKKTSGENIKVITSIGKTDPNYKVTVIRNNKNKELELVLPITEVFTEKGFLQGDLVYNWFSKHLSEKDE
ncbi:Microsomal signal peptidase 25 kDa subunit (SPC25) [Nakaseomyces glabratus]